jgi:hypothetical protein
MIISPYSYPRSTMDLLSHSDSDNEHEHEHYESHHGIDPDEAFNSSASTGLSCSSNKKSNSAAYEMIPLEADFEPTELDVICARGKEAYNHPG